MIKIQSNIHETIYMMHGVMGKIIQRGYQLNELEENSEHLLESSKTFIRQTLPWYRRLFLFFCPSWWFQKKHQKDEEYTVSPWVEVEV
jgi:hypothetical protein